MSRGKEDHLLTRSTAPGIEVYGEKRVSVDNTSKDDDGAPVTTKIEYRVWNPFRSKLAAGIIGGIDNIYMKPGSKVRTLTILFRLALESENFNWLTQHA